MRLVPSFALAVIWLTSPAALAETETCAVRVVRAPDHVRAAIEARVGIEDSCTPLDVRVVPVRDGYYVIATSPGGEAHETNVRDANLVGELVLDWARLPVKQKAKQKQKQPTKTAVEPEPEPQPMPEPEPQPEPEPVAAESSTPTPVAVTRTTAAAKRSTRDFVVGALMSNAGYGARAEVDVLAGAGFSLTLALGIMTSDWEYETQMSTSNLTFRDVRGVAAVAKTFGSGAWRLRAQAGVGLLQTAYTGKMRFSTLEAPVEGDGMTTMVEASLMFAFDVGDHWALSLGPLFTYFNQSYTLDNGVVETHPTREYDVAAYMAVRRRL